MIREYQKINKKPFKAGYTVYISDPCYDPEKKLGVCVETPSDTKEYNAILCRARDEYGSWNHALILVLDGAVAFADGNRQVYADTFGVDTASAVIYLDNNDKPKYTDEEWQKLCAEELIPENRWVHLDNPDNPFKARVIGCTSGFGDGDYDIFKIYNKDGEYIGIEILFD